MRGEDASNMLTIPIQNKVTQQIISLWQSFKDLTQAFAVSRRAEQLLLRSQQRIIATAEDSVLQTEMANLESQKEDDPRRVLWFKPMIWLGQIRPHRRDEAWSASLWQTFFAASVGAQIPLLPEVPLSDCGCKEFQIDALGDYFCTCTAHLGVKKTHDWSADQMLTSFAPHTK